jgi:hypothetical protein
MNSKFIIAILAIGLIIYIIAKYQNREILKVKALTIEGTEVLSLIPIEGDWVIHCDEDTHLEAIDNESTFIIRPKLDFTSTLIEDIEIPKIKIIHNDKICRTYKTVSFKKFKELLKQLESKT